MTNGPIRRGIWRQFVLWTLTGALLFANAGFDGAPGLKQLRRAFDRRHQEVAGRDRGRGRQRGYNGETLAGFRDTLNSAADILRKKIDWLEPRAREAGDRLKELGPARPRTPAEHAEIASQREELTAQFNDVDGELERPAC